MNSLSSLRSGPLDAKCSLRHLNSGGAALSEPQRSRMPHEPHTLSDTETSVQDQRESVWPISSDVCRWARAQRPEKCRERRRAWCSL